MQQFPVVPGQRGRGGPSALTLRHRGDLQHGQQAVLGQGRQGGEDGRGGDDE